ncbi:MAG: histidinol dehydrogenase [Rhodospirillales bacterium]|jgi:sulfopropanediol 3-dehydrogenase|nr:histidinol dehydrogenase [Rhodospirillales bacterium]MBT4039821.1 histidinol dehydrogenase [Rhodospirillales bacterium]MBT4625967.1 histidinol dehydrogenase [Rhodospirillales bacterium]MBT5520309.1 histidinol dehydrogenase [Rhodospirillales bacterium]MBT6110569.1 histidinol dehydrogenase [Rhodospirillales bacterium]
MEYIKRSQVESEAEDNKIREAVEGMLSRIRAEGETAVAEYARTLDSWDQPFVLSEEKKRRLISEVTDQEKEDIQFAHAQIKRFAEAQRASLTEFDMETEPGVRLGQRIVPVNCAGCYVPGGRYAHAASAIMSIATAKVAGVPFVVAASPPRGASIAPQVAYAMDLAGADMILEMGGVQAVATMAFGLFGARPADILVGPGNAYVAEAKRLLFGEVGIDVFAGPTESAVIADETADPMTVAIDLAGQAEHGPNSPVWLFTTSRELADTVDRILPKIAKDFPSGDVIAAAWRDYGEIVYCETREEVCEVSDRYASEHLQVIAEDLDWWKERLKNYGSLFLGEGANVTHGDKCSGTNHILPTKGAARYTGGLNVMKFLKILTWQKISEEANFTFSSVASRISRLEGMDGHARACDWRLKKYFPDTDWDFDVADQQRYD